MFERIYHKINKKYQIKINKNIKKLLKKLLIVISELNTSDKIETLNYIKKQLHNESPFKNEPVDCVLWVNSENIKANDYNPNFVAPPEMELLKQSIYEDGFTQPIVSWKHDEYIEVVDGFHRNRVGRECEEIKERIYGYLPVVNINEGKQGKSDRMASTIRHNRARGTHNVELMSTIVAELVEMGKGDRWICKHIGMSADELLRLKQITGVAALFKNKDFSDSWEADKSEMDEIQEYLEQKE
jgi:ParB-like chromosome segregation protein Spo0J